STVVVPGSVIPRTVAPGTVACAAFAWLAVWAATVDGRPRRPAARIARMTNPRQVMTLFTMSTSRFVNSIKCTSDEYNLRAPQSLHYRVDVRFSTGKTPGMAPVKPLSGARGTLAVDEVDGMALTGPRISA